jgi:hypothetical protein
MEVDIPAFHWHHDRLIRRVVDMVEFVPMFDEMHDLSLALKNIPVYKPTTSVFHLCGEKGLGCFA